MISPYFKHTNKVSEQDLINDLSRETVYLRGQDFSYIPRDSSDADTLFGEDVKSTFTAAVTLEMICTNMTGFDGEGDFFSRYGLDIRDEANFEIHKGRFTEVVTAVYPEIERPREGDLIYYAMASTILEITFVEPEKPFYTRGVQTMWNLTLKKFEYNHDEMSSGIPAVDDIKNTVDYGDDSESIQEESDTIIDFDESDPFSNNTY